jgi:hypothetical protein
MLTSALAQIVVDSNRFGARAMARNGYRRRGRTGTKLGCRRFPSRTAAITERLSKKANRAAAMVMLKVILI